MEGEWREHLESNGPGRMRIKKHGRMLTDAIMIADEKHIKEHTDDRSPNQVINTASLPGIVGNAWAMADWHFGYGFPIGGVVATDTEAGELGGSISPGGVGFDINCGVRLCSLDIGVNDINIKELSKKLAQTIPSGASRKGGVKLNLTELEVILSEGAGAAVDLGWGESRDLFNIESNGLLDCQERKLSERAMKRGMSALGTLGSGNHFLELQIVDKIVDHEAAKSYGLRKGQITAMIHTGSRGLGHQVCSEHVNAIESKYQKNDGFWHAPEWDIQITDRQLAAAPIYSKEGQEYVDSMNAAGNYAFANRSALTQRLRNSLRDILGRDSNLKLIYDVSHNIAKIENHEVHGKQCKCCVHRKGATRALGGDHVELSNQFSGIGQPVLVPGDMGTASWVLAGPKIGSNDAFASSCHGAGRKLSRTAARNSIDSVELKKNLEAKGIYVNVKTPNVLSEEAPDAYKDVDEVIDLTQKARLARPVARLKPFAVIKG
ncbi:MAG: RtcB family protein [Candidatus Poseidoniales archaeon]|jgi:tRNA-splicing ligase RtcB|tara:strand:- start:1448 stop:2920 length:1473 start_codon:yes stop_codon:yes gene_type:complete